MPLVRAEVLVQLEVYNTTSVVSAASRVISRSTVAMELVWAVQYYLPFMVSCQVHLSLYVQYIVIRASLSWTSLHTNCRIFLIVHHPVCF